MTVDIHLCWQEENKMSTNAQKTPLQLQLEELVKVGVGGKFNNKDNPRRIRA